MKKVLVCVIFSMLLAAATPAMSKVLFYDDCEDYPSLTDDGGTDWGLTESSGNFKVSADRKKAGSKSYKMEFAPTAVNTGKRVELVLRAEGLKNFEFNKEYWLGWSMYIPSDFVMPTWAVLGQWHKAGQNLDGDCDQAPRPENPATAQPYMSFISGTSSEPTMRVQITGQSDYCQPWDYDYFKSFTSPKLKKGSWNDVVMHTKFKYDGKGITQMWLNGVKFIDISAVNAHNDPKPPTFKLGIYASSSKAHTVYYDEIRIGDANSNYNEVAPKGGVAPLPDPTPTQELKPPHLSIVGN